jgi:protein transport protein SEC20
MIDADNVSNRDELFRSSALQEKDSAMTTACVDSSHIRKHTDCEDSDDALMKANNNVTDALRRTMTLMQGELEKSVLSTQMLGMFPIPPHVHQILKRILTEESSATLRSASSQHDTLTLVMGTSKQLIAALERSDWLDRMLILSGLVFFGLVVFFILKQASLLGNSPRLILIIPVAYC